MIMDTMPAIFRSNFTDIRDGNEIIISESTLPTFDLSDECWEPTRFNQIENEEVSLNQKKIYIFFYPKQDSFPQTIFCPLTKEVNELIKKEKLDECLEWLKTTALAYFPNSTIELELIYNEEDDQETLDLAIHCTMLRDEFRNKRHLLFQEMLRLGHKKLYNILSISQWRTKTGGWQIFHSNSATTC